ncbi:hypothetical protein BC629DRAFT_1601359 [Irpex lacteus]|nr:hypothetical protein BC629DRAFT_1601359 [Irpex lacteus]
MTESTNGSAQPAAHLGLNLGQGGSDPGSAGSSRQPPARQQQPSPPPTQAAQQPPQQPQQPVAPPPAQPPAQPAAQPEPARGQPAQQHPEQQLAPAVPQQDQQPAARAEDPVQEGQARGAVHAAAAPSVDLVAAIRDPNFLALWQQQLGNAATSAADPVAPTVGTLPVVPVSRRRELGPIVPGFRADPYARREYCFFILSSPPLSSGRPPLPPTFLRPHPPRHNVNLSPPPSGAHRTFLPPSSPSLLPFTSPLLGLTSPQHLLLCCPHCNLTC